ncbi:ras GTPase-activating-like protein IQGAP1, partial [Eurytemora carolleeae]|uniref:ras GTPase-activating-like protein IQGAP1 n=1 Tax=Eurytemora carolleeae TaxID=1294199 RepID=UPI000C785340
MDAERVDIDTKRQENSAYEYLCHLEEAKNWISECIGENLPPATELEANFTNGVYLAKLAHFCAPNLVPRSKIFDADQERFRRSGLHFKHTENINFFLQAARHVGLLEIFLPETTDIYDRKNMPRAIFCLHALSLVMYKNGSAPRIEDLFGRVQFTDAEITLMQDELNKAGVELPEFRKLGVMLTDDGDQKKMEELFSELCGCIEIRDVEGMFSLLRNPVSRLKEVHEENSRQYMLVLHSEYRELGRPFSQAELQELISRTNLLVSLEGVKTEVLAEDAEALLFLLQDPCLGVAHLLEADNAELYLTNLLDYVEGMDENEVLKKTRIYEAVVSANLLGKEKNSLEHAIAEVNAALRHRDSSRILEALQHPALHLPVVLHPAAHLYYTELGIIQRDSESDLNYDGIYKPLLFLNLVAQVGIAGLAGDVREVKKALTEPELYIQDLANEGLEQYAESVIKRVLKSGKLLTHSEIQEIIDNVNDQYSQDIQRLKYIERVNNAVRGGGEGLVEALEGLGFKISSREEIRCFQELINIQSNKSQIEEREMELWLEDIEEAYRTVQDLASEAESIAGALRGINSAAEYGDVNGVLSYLFNNWELFGLRDRPERKDGADILKGFQRRMVGKRDGQHSWVKHYFQDGSEVFIEVEGGRIAWTKPKVVKKLEEDIRRRRVALGHISKHTDVKMLEKKVTIIQRAWRARKLRAQWKLLIESGKADLTTVVKHLHLLDVRVSDAQEELELARARGELTKLMRKNESLEEEVEGMDKKIGLLVQNRISVQVKYINT